MEENYSIDLKVELQKYIDKNNSVGLEILRGSYKKHIKKNILSYIYENDVLFYEVAISYNFKNNIFFYYDDANNILYTNVYFGTGSSVIPTFINIINNIIDNNNNIIFITVRKLHNIIDYNSFIKYVKKYFGIIYINIFGDDIIKPLSDVNNFIFYRKYKNNNRLYGVNCSNKISHGEFYIIPETNDRIVYKQKVYNKILYTFITLVIKKCFAL